MLEILEIAGLIIPMTFFAIIYVMSAVESVRGFLRKRKEPSPQEALAQHLQEKLGPGVTVEFSADGRECYILRNSPVAG